MYKITPTPLVVELDMLNEPTPQFDSEDSDSAPTLGRKLQDLLGEVTGRTTVPNIMVGMHSIGGNDLIWAMHEEGTLAEKIQKLAGKRIFDVELSDER